MIYSYAPGYGSDGPKSRLQSFAPLHSGFVGIHSEASGEGNPPMQTFGNEDYYNGQLNAIGILLALLHKARTGEGQYVECAQLSSSVFVTSHWYRAGGERRSVLPRLDHDQYGWTPYARIYQCLEGYVCVYCAEPAQQEALRRIVLGAPDPATEEIGEQLAYEFFGRPADAWVETLRAAGVPCTVVDRGLVVARVPPRRRGDHRRPSHPFRSPHPRPGQHDRAHRATRGLPTLRTGSRSAAR